MMKSCHLLATSAENSSQMQLSPSESCDEYEVIINYSPKPRNLNGLLLLDFFLPAPRFIYMDVYMTVYNSLGCVC